MRALGIETSGRLGSVALVIGGAEVVTIELAGGGRHEAGIAPAAREVLARGGIALRDLDAIAVGLGPGSYTGVRIGVTFAKTLAYATGIALVGIPGLLAQAGDAGVASGGRIVVLEPAHPGRVYGAAYVVGAGPPRVLRAVGLWTVADVLAAVPPPFRAVGRAAAGHRTAIEAAGGELGPDEVPVRAAAIAQQAVRHLAAGGTPDDPAVLAPLYLQPPAPER